MSPKNLHHGLFMASLIILSACNDKSDGTWENPGSIGSGSGGTETTGIDNDGDGFLAEEDCDDADPTINPGAEEVCDGTDNNCDGQIDEDVTDTFYADSDDDGFGEDTSTTEACEAQDHSRCTAVSAKDTR